MVEKRPMEKCTEWRGAQGVDVETYDFDAERRGDTSKREPL